MTTNGAPTYLRRATGRHNGDGSAAAAATPNAVVVLGVIHLPVCEVLRQSNGSSAKNQIVPYCNYHIPYTTLGTFEIKHTISDILRYPRISGHPPNDLMLPIRGQGWGGLFIGLYSYTTCNGYHIRQGRHAEARYGLATWVLLLVQVRHAMAFARRESFEHISHDYHMIEGNNYGHHSL